MVPIVSDQKPLPDCTRNVNVKHDEHNRVQIQRLTDQLTTFGILKNGFQTLLNNFAFIELIDEVVEIFCVLKDTLECQVEPN